MNYIIPYSPNEEINNKQRYIKKNKKKIIEGKRKINSGTNNAFGKVKRTHHSYLQIPVLDSSLIYG